MQQLQRRWLFALVLVAASLANAAPTTAEVVPASISADDVSGRPTPDGGPDVLAPSAAPALSGLLPSGRAAPIGPSRISARLERTCGWTFAVAGPDRRTRDPEFRAAAALARGGALSAPSTAPPAVPLPVIIAHGSAASVS